MSEKPFYVKQQLSDAASTLSFYLERAGGEWHGENSIEVEEAVEKIFQAAVDQIRYEVQSGHLVPGEGS